jgi:hypothetical protein
MIYSIDETKQVWHGKILGKYYSQFVNYCLDGGFSVLEGGILREHEVYWIIAI